MRSLEEWTKYLEEQEEAALDIVRSREREVQPEKVTPAPVRQAEPEVSVVEPVAEAQTLQVPQAPQPPVVVEDVPVQSRVPEEHAASAESIVKLTQLRKQLPEQILLPDDGDSEVAQNSYKAFKESREELLQRLLDPQISLEDAARILNVCPTTVRRYTNRGLLRHYRTPGNQRRFRLSDVLALLESQNLGILSAEDE